jgi:serine/threonine protein phosphatase 1
LRVLRPHSQHIDDTVITHYGINAAGRDFVVGDIHGHFPRLEMALADIRFNAEVDRLFSVGDMVDRGAQSEQALDWLDRPWFHPVRGNHEDYAIRHGLAGLVDIDNYRHNGGGWFLDLPREQQQRFARAFSRLPFVIEVETAYGIVGILHADCPVNDWLDLAEALESRRNRDHLIWSRARIEHLDAEPVKHIHAVVVGHTPVNRLVRLGNVLHIDTAGWTDQGYFTLLDLATITPDRLA